MATPAIKENSIVRFTSVEVANNLFASHNLPTRINSVDDYYGIVKDSYNELYYVEFFNHTTKTLDILAVPANAVEKIGGLYDIIKKSVMSSESKNIVAKIKPAKKEKEIEVISNENNQEQTNTISNTTKSSPASLKDLRIISTGKYQFFTSKEDFISEIESNGGVYQGAVNSKLDYIVVCSGANQKRLESCRAIGITEISEYDFYNRVMNKNESK